MNSREIYNSIESLSMRMLSDFNTLTLPWFEEYGINKDNCKEYSAKIGVTTIPSLKRVDYFLNSKYVFSIRMIPEIVAGSSFSFKFEKFMREKEIDPEQED